MEHLPLPHNARLTQHDEVPHVAFDDGYDDGPLFSYLKRTNRPEMREGSQAAIRFYPNPEYQGENSYKLAPLYQTWLFFGFLHEILGPSFRHQDFVGFAPDSRTAPGSQDNVMLLDLLHVRSRALGLRTPGTWSLTSYKLSRSINRNLRSVKSRKVICTTVLPGLLDEWTVKIQNDPDVSRVLLKARVCIGMVHDALLWAKHPKFPRNVSLSIASVAELVETVANQAFAKLGITPETQDFHPELLTENSFGNWGVEDFAVDMTRNGWCPYEATTELAKSTCLAYNFFCSRITFEDSARNHQVCTAEACQASLVTFKKADGPCHRLPGCACSTVAIQDADKAAMSEMLINGRIALVRIHDKKDNKDKVADLEVIPESLKGTHVAISHVWADGLGNKRDNVLQHCQIWYLQRVLQDLREKTSKSSSDIDPSFWIDTLCCPIQDMAAKKQAIRLMRKIYSRASQVLVLDAELERLRESDIDELELSARIFSSGWMRRLWTLQEGALAEELWIQLADGPINLSVLHEKVCATYHLSRMSKRPLAAELLSRHRALREFRHKGSGSEAYGLLGKACEFRQITNANDEPICIASLMGCDAGTIYGTADEDRMKELWHLLADQGKGIPSEIIFNGLTKLNQPGFRWAPSTLLKVYTGDSLTSHSTPGSYGKLEKEGLVVSFCGALINMPPEPSSALQAKIWPCLKKELDALYVRDADGGWAQLISLRTQREIGMDPEMAPCFMFERLREPTNSIFAVILRSDRPPSQGLSGNGCSGILVRSSPTTDGTLVWHRERYVIVEYLNSDTWPAFDAALSIAQGLEESALLRRMAELVGAENPKASSVQELNMLHHHLHSQFIAGSSRLASIEGIANRAASILPIQPTDTLFRLIVYFTFRRYGWFEPCALRQWCID